jgi:hypothetical protein
MAVSSPRYHDAVELQRILLTAARKAETGPVALAAVARAWTDLEQEKRVMRPKKPLVNGKGKPRPAIAQGPIEASPEELRAAPAAEGTSTTITPPKQEQPQE